MLGTRSPAPLLIALAASTPATGQGWAALHPNAFAGQATFDLVRGRTVLLSSDGRSPLGETWEYDGANWRRAAPPVSPPARTGHTLTHDPIRQRCVIYGGRSVGTAPVQVFGDTWAFDGQTWTQLGVAGPGPRVDHAACMDLVRQHILLFGGSNGPLAPNDTWALTGGGWTRLLTATAPTPRFGHSMCFDWHRNRVVLFGGTAPTLTWELDGLDWHQIATPASPPGVFGAAMAFDEARGRTLLFGGLTGSGVAVDETWEYDGLNWSRNNAAPAPPPRIGAAISYDPVRRRTVLFGGTTSYHAFSDTWEFDGSAWVENTNDPPAPRDGALIAHDPVRHRTILVGGYGAGGAVQWNETWEYDGTRWQRLPQQPSVPFPGHGSITYDLFRHRTVYVAENMAICEFDGTTWSWVLRGGPPQLADHGLAYDFDRRRIVLFGGRLQQPPFTAQSDTWEYDGQAWANANISAPSPRSAHGMVYDGARHRTTVFGGANALGVTSNDTLTYDGRGWVTQRVTHPPPPQVHCALAFDSVRGRVVAVGNGTWEYDGTDWTAIDPTPLGLAVHAAFDAAHGRVVAFGPRDVSRVANAGTWELEAPRAPTASSFGSGCAAGTSIATLSVANGAVPSLGSTVPFAVSGLPARPGTLVVASGTDFGTWLGAALPLDAGWIATGCAVWVAPIASFFVAHGGASAAFAVAIPNDPRLAGLVFGVQCLVVDPAGAQFVDGLTNAMLLRVH